jgi:hypothetical protein
MVVIGQLLKKTYLQFNALLPIAFSALLPARRRPIHRSPARRQLLTPAHGSNQEQMVAIEDRLTTISP